MSNNVIISGKISNGKTTSFDEIVANSLRFKPSKIFITDLKEIKLSSTTTGKINNRE